MAGRNYGWPLTSKGVNDNGAPIDYGTELDIEFDLADIEQPVVDLTPSPAVSNLVVYRGDAFPEWCGHLLVDSLKGAALEFPAGALAEAGASAELKQLSPLLRSGVQRGGA